ncbi:MULTISPECIES: IclR family transcriptional regulator [unclassified Cupriavidus]|uniref:IclR family transcriptional regulator n=1 Tax=unclassified Cupriavidus TaxID=2640874 RepID=UPI001056062C|nr:MULTISPECIES: IclR family transcriptional regulator [unclassified Cupriavidus]MBF6989142.1 IclR family transcriptional regulator [Cupriavidus sp. IK-TO18]TDF62151.1 IclR family transcriptional regulator [Cupriavidus sp. L7L]
MARQKTTDVDRSVNAVGRTLSILDAFLQHEGPLTLSDLESETGLFKSVILRYMLSLEPMNYVVKRPDGRYQLGARVFELGIRYEQTFNLSEHVMPVLEALMRETEESASFYIREGDSRICLLRKDSPQHLKASIAPGTRLPMDDTATAEVLRIFSTPVDFAWSVKNCIFTSARKVNPVTAGQQLTSSMSAPVLRHGNTLAGALTISGPVGRFDPAVKATQNLLFDSAKELSKSLGASV